MSERSKRVLRNLLVAGVPPEFIAASAIRARLFDPAVPPVMLVPMTPVLRARPREDAADRRNRRQKAAARKVKQTQRRARKKSRGRK